MSSELVMYSVIISMLLGVILALTGLYFKKKGKEWWLFLSLVGIAGIVINGIKIFQM